MLPVFIHDKAEIETYLRRNPFLHLYALGDLDDFFWPYTSWIAEKEGNLIQSLLLVYSGGGLPVLLAIADEERDRLRDLLSAAIRQPLLPRRFYTHLSPGLAEVIAAAGYSLEPHGRYVKMALLHSECISKIDTSQVVPLGRKDEHALLEMYDESYPGNWFDPRMLDSGCYYGIWSAGRVISAAGVHVYSPQYRAAALGNICTNPDFRGQGLGTAVTAKVCQALSGKIDYIGLNVRANNLSALTAYTRVGFEPVAVYEEYLVGELDPS